MFFSSFFIVFHHKRDVLPIIGAQQ